MKYKEMFKKIGYEIVIDDDDELCVTKNYSYYEQEDVEYIKETDTIVIHKKYDRIARIPGKCFNGILEIEYDDGHCVESEKMFTIEELEAIYQYYIDNNWIERN